MKVTKEQAELNRDALLDAASCLYREYGLEGVGVSQIARAAGLTHGSLYGHFESKDHFAAEACERAFAKYFTNLQSVPCGDKKELYSFIREYLSEQHRDAPRDGCPVATLGSDAGRKNALLGQTMTQGIETYLTLLGELYSSLNKSAAANRDHAITTLAMMVGGLVLSRATSSSNPSLSKLILTALRGVFRADTR